MNFDSLFSGSGAFLGVIAAVVAFIFLIAFLRSLLKVTLPNRMLVVTGRKRKRGDQTLGFSVERGSTVVIPYLQTSDTLSLDVFPINVKVDGVNSANGITLGAYATACVCVDDDDEGMLYSSVERLMGKRPEEIKDQVQQTLIGNFRGALNKATPLQAIGMQESYSLEEAQANDTDEGRGDRALFRSALVEDINSDISSFGMKVVSVSLQTIWDSSNYIANLAQKTTADKRQQVEVEEARLMADAKQAESDVERRMKVAKSRADEKIVAAREKLEVYRRESTASIDQARYEADNSIVEAESRGQKEVEELNNELLRLKNESDILLKERTKQEAARIVAEGEQQAAQIVDNAYNSILKQKAELLKQAGNTGNLVLFVKQQMPRLYQAFKSHAENFKVDSYLVMDDEKGFNGAVNRGPEAFVDFLRHFENATGIKIQDFLTVKN